VVGPLIALVQTGEKMIPALKDQGILILVTILIVSFGQIMVDPDQGADHWVMQRHPKQARIPRIGREKGTRE